MRIKTFCFRLASVAVLLGSLSGATGQQQVVKLRPAGTIVGAGPYSFPEKITVDGIGNLYLFDSSLSNVFVVNARERGTRVTPLCSPRTPVVASDVSVERGGEVWILDSIASKIIKLDRNCKTQKSFVARNPALALQVNSSGEVVVLTSAGKSLFDLYDQSGNLLRSFGQRISYGNPIADGELSNGHMVADTKGGFYFSFNYPPLVRHYGRDGKLLGEFNPLTDVSIGAPNVSSEKQGNRVRVRSNYQIWILDMTLDERGRLIFLLSGKPKSQAIRQGSQTLMVTSVNGRVLRRLVIEDTSFHRLVAGRAALYLLRNRDGLRLDKYNLP